MEHLKINHVTLFKLQISPMATLHVGKHVITVKPYHIAMFLIIKKIFGLYEIFVIAFL